MPEPMTPAELAAELRRLNAECERELDGGASTSRVNWLERVDLLRRLAPALPDLIEWSDELLTCVDGNYREVADQLRTALAAVCAAGRKA